MSNPNINPDRVLELALDQMLGTGNHGICLACGAERDGCEPDAEGYECYECGAHKVVGAELAAVMLL